MFPSFIHNGNIKPISEALIPVSCIEYTYGFGVYEALRVIEGIPTFIDDHIERLMLSAKVIDLEHPWTTDDIRKFLQLLTTTTQERAYNIKLLLIGGRRKEGAQIFAIPLAPHFPEKKLYRDGVAVCTYSYERLFPHAKTLNMLGSYLAYREAQKRGCYDALLRNRNGNITEGTRTNFFVLKGKEILMAPKEEVLEGVTMKHVLDVASAQQLKITECQITLDVITHCSGAFITSTSSKILPIKSIDAIQLPPVPNELRELMKGFDTFIETWREGQRQ